jgi:Ca2+-binding RTX toxin-like protein
MFAGRDYDFTRPHTGPISISPNHEMNPSTRREVTFRIVVENHGPGPAVASFRWHVSGYKGEPGTGYTFWTAPTLLTTNVRSSVCPSVRRCTYELDPGGALEFAMSVRGNAPGRFTSYGTVASDSADPVPANNTTEVFDEPVVCSIEGTSADDVLVGTSGFDSICGKSGDDRIKAVGDYDKVFGGGGDDLMLGQPKSQQFSGGRGSDTISYAAAPRGVEISLVDRGARGWGWDIVLGLENVIGSRYGDYLEGSSRANRLVGRGGADRLYGRGGRDTLLGKGGSDDFISRDSAADFVSGGTGSDGAYRDAYDRVVSSGSVGAPSFADLDIAPPSG